MTPSEPDPTAVIEQLVRRVAVLEAESAVRKLQHQYGYYLDNCLYQEVVELFSDDSEVVFVGGRYLGKAGVRRLYVDRLGRKYTNGMNGPVFGLLLDHPQHQDVITVGPDGTSAKARFRTTMQAGLHDAAKATSTATVSMQQWWEGGLYENEYVLEDGVWKISVLNYRPLYHGEFDSGWAHNTPMRVFGGKTFPEDPLGPDELLEHGYALFPNTELFPYHYPHPVTGREVRSDDDDAARHP